MPFYVGLDLGQSADYTALAVVEDVEKEGPAGKEEKFLHLRHLERYPLRTPYPEQAGRVARLMRDEKLVTETRYPWEPTVYRKVPELVVDATGVGRAVTDLLKERGLWFKAVTITGGDAAKYSGRGASVPKRDLVAALEVPFHSGTLKVAEGLELWPALRAELLNFRRKINLKTAHDSYEHWRESDHDDLVLAAALACWWATRKRGLTPVPKSAVGYPKPKGW
jgi:hypothetical protein